MKNSLGKFYHILLLLYYNYCGYYHYQQCPIIQKRQHKDLEKWSLALTLRGLLTADSVVAAMNWTSAGGEVLTQKEEGRDSYTGCHVYIVGHK